MFKQLPVIKVYPITKENAPYLRIVTGSQVEKLYFDYTQYETIGELSEILITLFDCLDFRDSIVIDYDKEKDNDLEVYYDGDVVISVIDKSLHD